MIKQPVLPVINSLKMVEKACHFKVEFVVLMDFHIAQLRHACHLLKKHGKKIIIHIDLIKGLKNDEYAVDFLIHSLNVDGIISVKSSVIEKVKRLQRISVQRLFLIDTLSYTKGMEIVQASKPDYIELLPGCMDKMIRRTKEKGFQVLAGGLIETPEEVERAIQSGATAITTSKPELIKRYAY